MNTKRIMSLLLCLLALCAIFSFTSCNKNKTEEPQKPSSSPSASLDGSKTEPNSPFTLSLSQNKAKAGETVTVTLSAQNNPSIAGYSVTVLYDEDVLTFVSCENKIAGGFAVANSTQKGKVRVMCTVMGGNTLSTEGVCDVLTFKVKEDAPKGTSALELVLADDSDEIYRTENGKMPSINCIVKRGAVTVE